MPQPRQTAPPEGQPEDAPPPPEWEGLGFGRAADERPSSGARLPDLTALFALIEALRAMVPRELEDQFSALVRELLLTIRAAVDWYLERLDGGPREPPIENIPID